MAKLKYGAGQADSIARFLADALQADNCEGGANKLNLTSVRHHDDAPTVALETMSGLRFQFTVKMLKGGGALALLSAAPLLPACFFCVLLLE